MFSVLIPVSKLHQVVAGAQRHDDLFHRRVAGTLAEPVDGALHLPRARLHGAERVGDREPEVVVAVHREHRLVDVGHPVEQHGDQGRELVGHRVAHRVGDVDGAGARLDRRFDAAAEEVVLGARAVLAGPLDIVGEAPRVGHAVDHRRVHVVRLHLQLDAHVERAGRDEGVDAPGPRPAPAPRPPGRCPAARRGRARTRCSPSPPWRPRGPPRSRRWNAMGKPASITSTAHLLEDLGDPELLLEVHRRARRLFAVAHRRIEYSDSLPCIGHGGHPFTPAGYDAHRASPGRLPIAHGAPFRGS